MGRLSDLFFSFRMRSESNLDIFEKWKTLWVYNIIKLRLGLINQRYFPYIFYTLNPKYFCLLSNHLFPPCHAGFVGAVLLMVQLGICFHYVLTATGQAGDSLSSFIRFQDTDFISHKGKIISGNSFERDLQLLG